MYQFKPHEYCIYLNIIITHKILYKYDKCEEQKTKTNKHYIQIGIIILN